MEVIVKQEDEVAVVVLSGFLQAESVPVFRDKFTEETIDSEKILLDCTDLEYLDSSGLATLVHIVKGLNARGAKMVIFGLPSAVYRVIQFTKLDRVLQIAGNKREATNLL